MTELSGENPLTVVENREGGSRGGERGATMAMRVREKARGLGREREREEIRVYRGRRSRVGFSLSLIAVRSKSDRIMVKPNQIDSFGLIWFVFILITWIFHELKIE